MSGASAARYAVYYAPGDDHPLWGAGCSWLGRNPANPHDHRPAPPQRREPWRYGFHATLKAPLCLAPGRDEAQLHEALQALATRTAAFAMPRLQIDTLADFIALRPAAPLPRDHALWRLADACVRELDAFRAPPSAAERARRLSKPLEGDALQRLEQWGYPHVLEGWRFHMTLSDALPAAERQALMAAAHLHFHAALALQPLRCTDFCLFKQPAADAPFLLRQRYRLAGA